MSPVSPPPHSWITSRMPRKQSFHRPSFIASSAFFFASQRARSLRQRPCRETSLDSRSSMRAVRSTMRLTEVTPTGREVRMRLTSSRVATFSGIDGLDAVTAPQARLLGRGPDGDGVEPRAPLHEELTGMRHGLVPQKRLETLGGHGLLAPGVFLGLLELPLLLGHHLARERRGNRKGQAHRADRRSDQETVAAATGTHHDFLH